MVSLLTRTPRVLVIDDEDGDHAVIAGALESAGIGDVEFEKDPERGLERAIGEPFDVVLIAEQIGNSSGLDLINHARSNALAAALLLYTKSEDVNTEIRAWEAGSDGCLFVSDLSPATVERSVRHAIDRQQTLSELEAIHRRLEMVRGELSRRTASQDEFLRAVGHAVRNPLTAVVGLAELLRDPQLELDSGTRANMANTIVESGFEVTNLIDDLLTAARLETGRLAFDAVALRLLTLSQQVNEDLGEPASIEVKSQEAAAIGDPGRVRQILRILLDHARLHGGDHISMEVDSEGGIATVTVVYEGPDLASADEDSMFELPTVTPDQVAKGTHRMGLGVARELARRMGGELEYERSATSTRIRLALPTPHV